MLTQTLRCLHCGSDHRIRNGHAKNGKQVFRCKDRHKCGRENPGSASYDAATKALILLACHIERFNNTLRQRMARLVRKTLSFSKLDAMHESCLGLFLDEYNQPKYQQLRRRKYNDAKHH